MTSPKQRKRETSELGRPSAYREEFAEQARKLCRLGATDKELADFFGVSERTVNAWKEAHPDFLQSLKEGKSAADAEVAEKLFSRATGYEHPEDKIMQYEGSPVIVPTVKHYPPDTAACIFWLKNRRPDLWRDRVQNELSGPNGGPIETTSLTPAEEQALSDLVRKVQEGVRK